MAGLEPLADTVDATLLAPKECGAPAYYIASVGRALTLLSAFGNAEQLTVSEAAELLGTAPSTAHRMLQMLVYHGFVEQREDRAYARGPAATSLGNGSERHLQLESVAALHLRALRDRVQATTHLMRLEGNGARFVVGAEWRDEQTLTATARVGWLLPAHVVAGGKVLLANLSGDELDALYPVGLPITPHGQLRSLTELHRMLRRVRTRGYAITREAHKKVYAMAVAGPAQRGTPRFSVSVGWEDCRFPVSEASEALRHLRAAAAAIAEAAR